METDVETHSLTSSGAGENPVEEEGLKEVKCQGYHKKTHQIKRLVVGLTKLIRCIKIPLCDMMPLPRLRKVSFSIKIFMNALCLSEKHACREIKVDRPLFLPLNVVSLFDGNTSFCFLSFCQGGSTEGCGFFPFIFFSVYE